jgi:hypothetical protein
MTTPGGTRRACAVAVRPLPRFARACGSIAVRPLPRFARACGSIAAALALAACKKDYAHVYVQSADPALTSAPAQIDVLAYAGGASTAFSYTGSFVPRDGQSTPSSDFVLELDGHDGADVEVRVSVPTGGVASGGDARVARPANGAAVVLPLAPAESTLGQARIDAAGGRSIAFYGAQGVAIAWPDPTGVVLRVVKSVDVATVTRDTLVSSDTGATSVDVASPEAPAPDIVAVVWRGADGQGSALGFTASDKATHGPVPIGAADEVRVACALTSAPFRIVALRRHGGAVSASLLDATTASLGAFDVAVGSVDALVGAVVTADSSVVFGARAGGASTLYRVTSQGAIAGSSPVPGDLRAIATTADGTRVLAASVAGGALHVGSYFAATLTPGDDRVVAPWTSPPDPLAGVVLSDCLVGWPEVRNDGSSVVDVRAQYLDLSGAPVASSHFANATLAGDHFAPGAACLSATSAYVTFVGRADPTAVAGSIVFRGVASAP